MEAAQHWRPRPYLGMSGIGESCARKLWYQWRWCKAVRFNALTLKRFAGGDAAEAVVIKRLRMVDGLTVLAVDPKTGYQHAMSDLGGHYKGHADGLVLGLIQAPKSWHVLEVKESEKFNDLVKLKRDVGEKAALKKWNETYYAQAQSYMHYLDCDRHYLICATPGVRDWVSVRTDYSKSFSEQLGLKASRIVFADTPPERISDDPCWYQCRWCDYSDICHDKEFQQINHNCRTCMFSTPLINGQWKCEKYNSVLDYEQQLHGCDYHRLIPDLVGGEQIDAANDGAWILYKLPDGQEWLDGERK